MTNKTQPAAAVSRGMSLALCAALLAGLLVACGGDDGAGAVQARAQETQALDKAVRMAREANAVKVKGERARTTE
jgi:hypothetical protein